VIGHGGGIPGFQSQVTYYPEHDLSVIVLINTIGPPGPGAIAGAIADLILGDQAEPPNRTYSGDAEALAGTYRGPGRGRESVVTIGIDENGLTAAAGNSEPSPLTYLEGLTFGGNSTRFTFVMVEGEVDRLLVDQISGLLVLKRDDR